MPLESTAAGTTECVHSFPTTPPLGSMEQPGACRTCDTTYEEAKQQMPAPATVVTSRSVSLNITGPDVPNRYGEGHIAPSRVDFTYRTGEVRAWLEGRWRRTDGVLTDAPASQPYTGDMAGWPDWLANLARKHDPRGAAPSTDRAALVELGAQAIWARYSDAEPSRHGLVMANPHAAAQAVLSVLSGDRAAVLREEAALIRAHCPDHLDSNSAEGSWINCHCDVADDMERRLAAEARHDGRSTAEKAADLGLTDTEYRAQSHAAAVATVRAAIPGMYAHVGFRVEDVLNEPGEVRPTNTQASCGCPHPADEHSVYGCADGCGCEWMPKKPAVMEPAEAPREWCKCRSCWGWFVEEHPGEDLDELGKDLGWWSGLPEHRDPPAVVEPAEAADTETPEK